MGELIPFDPNIHKPVQTIGDGYATEYLASEGSPDGDAWNIPNIWFDEDSGKPRLLVGDAAWEEAFKYEQRTGKKFPRYDSIGLAVSAAENRSRAGGASSKALAD
tara:strand:+ start:914 stop:1228 length:315 start_codon:yes stop_codon:yes gene_type:complete